MIGKIYIWSTEGERSKSLFYKDCSLGSVKPVYQLVIAKRLMSKRQAKVIDRQRYLQNLSNLSP